MSERYKRWKQDIILPVLISHLPVEQCSSDSGAEIFISVSISHAPIALGARDTN